MYLVEGKAGYRVTGGKFINNIFFSLKESSKLSRPVLDNLEYQDDFGEGYFFKKKVTVIKNIFSLLDKIFLHNERDHDIFTLLENFVESLFEINEEDVLKEKEVLFLSKLFYLWGYFDENDLLEVIGKESLELKFSEKEIQQLKEKINLNISKIAF